MLLSIAAQSVRGHTHTRVALALSRHVQHAEAAVGVSDCCHPHHRHRHREACSRWLAEEDGRQGPGLAAEASEAVMSLRGRAGEALASYKNKVSGATSFELEKSDEE